MSAGELRAIFAHVDLGPCPCGRTHRVQGFSCVHHAARARRRRSVRSMRCPPHVVGQRACAAPGVIDGGCALWALDACCRHVVDVVPMERAA